MFVHCDVIKNLDLTSFNTINVTDMSEMFNYCEYTLSIDVSSFDTTNVTNMEYMFGSCWDIPSLDLSNFNTSNVTNMGSMFYGCSRLKNIIGTLDLQKVTNANYMFYGCSALEEVHIHNLGRNLSLSDSPKLTHDCLVELINNLQTVTSTKTLTLGSTNLAKLTDEEKQVATNKGWTLA